MSAPAQNPAFCPRIPRLRNPAMNVLRKFIGQFQTDGRLIGRAGSLRECALDTYEIRILRQEQAAPVVLACTQASDHAAIRRARSLARDGDLVEVWRGLDCVYTAPPIRTKHS